MPATDDDTLLPFALPNICKKKVTAAFDGGQVSSDGGVFVLAAADKRLGLIDTLVDETVQNVGVLRSAWSGNRGAG